jgi:hypothetical protein
LSARLALGAKPLARSGPLARGISVLVRAQSVGAVEAMLPIRVTGPGQLQSREGRLRVHLGLESWGFEGEGRW